MNMPRTVVTPIQIRFSDVDMFGHVNNASQQMYFDLGKTDFMRQALSLVTVATTNNFFRQIRYTDDIEVHTSVRKTGDKSVTLFQSMVDRRDGATVSDSLTVMAVFDFAKQASAPLPDEWRPKLLGWPGVCIRKIRTSEDVRIFHDRPCEGVNPPYPAKAPARSRRR